MSNRPKYLWLSILAFGKLSSQCRRTIKFEIEEKDNRLLYRYIGFELLWGSITLIVPAAIIVSLMYIFPNYADLINILGLVYLYFGGVILSSKIYDWKIENIKKRITDI